jgi:hypothetical protein
MCADKKIEVDLIIAEEKILFERDYDRQFITATDEPTSFWGN